MLIFIDWCRRIILFWCVKSDLFCRIFKRNEWSFRENLWKFDCFLCSMYSIFSVLGIKINLFSVQISDQIKAQLDAPALTVSRHYIQPNFEDENRTVVIGSPGGTVVLDCRISMLQDHTVFIFQSYIFSLFIQKTVSMYILVMGPGQKCLTRVGSGQN